MEYENISNITVTRKVNKDLITFQPGDKKVVEGQLLDGSLVEVSKKKKVLSVASKKRLKSLEADLMDDGKLNHSNDKAKKSPGRKKKK